MSQTTVIASVQVLLQTVTGIGTVDDRAGGEATWVSNPRPRQAYWVLEIVATSETTGLMRGTDAIGRHAFRQHQVQAEGWMPSNYDTNTTKAWRTLLDEICDTLRANRSLGNSINRASLPAITRNDYQWVEGKATQGGAQAATVRCHHAIIQVTAREYVTYQTT